MELTASATRRGKWWVVTVPEVRGLFTQVRRLDQVEAWVLDAAGMLDDQPAEGYTVTVVPQLDVDNERAVEEARRLRQEREDAGKRARAATDAVVARLRSTGMSSRDVAHLLGLSHSAVIKHV